MHWFHLICIVLVASIGLMAVNVHQLNVWGYCKLKLALLSIYSRSTILAIICRVMMEGESADDDGKSGDSMFGAGRTLDLVKDVLESMIGKAVDKCEDQNRSKGGKIVFSEQ